MDPFSEMLGNENQIILEMIDFRLVIETEYARIAAQCRTQEDLQLIRENLGLMQQEVEQNKIGLDGDNGFHDAIAMATHNSVFLKMLQVSKSLLSRTRETTLSIKGQPRLSLEDHWKVFKAIEAGDPEEAASQMRVHLMKAQQNAEDQGVFG